MQNLGHGHIGFETLYGIVHHPRLENVTKILETPWVEDRPPYREEIELRCAVNGPGEAKHADIAIAGGREEGLLIKKGRIIEKIPVDQMTERRRSRKSGSYCRCHPA